MLNTISAYWHMAGVAFIVLVLHRRAGPPPVVRVRLHGDASTTPGSAATKLRLIIFCYVFGLGLLMSQYTITGFDASAHMAEETHQASRMAAVGMYMSVVASVVFGCILLLAVTFAVPSTARRRSSNLGPRTWIWPESMGQNWAEPLLFICVVAQFFCLTASVTSASRMIFAFSRDGAFPGHRLLAAGRRATASRSIAVVAIGVLSGR